MLLMVPAPPLADFGGDLRSARVFRADGARAHHAREPDRRFHAQGPGHGAGGLLLGTIGIDVLIGEERYTFDSVELHDGLDFLPVAVGLFAIGELLYNLYRPLRTEPIKAKLSGLLPTRQDWKDSWGGIGRGTVIGFFVGVLPGAGATIASFLAYATEKRVSRRPEQFGTGVIEGVAAPESANNAASTGALVPLMALGIPGSGTTAVMLGALTLYGMQPGPLLMSTHPEVFWGLVASMYIGNVMLLILNLPLAPVSPASCASPTARSFRSSSALRSSGCTAWRTVCSTWESRSCLAASASSCDSTAIRPRLWCWRSCWGRCSRRRCGSRCRCRSEAWISSSPGLSARSFWSLR